MRRVSGNRLQTLGLVCVLGCCASGARAQAPAPQPFPQPNSPRPSAPRGGTPPPPPATTSPPPSTPATTGTPAPAAAATVEGAPTEALLGVPIYPAAQFLGSYDAGHGQRYYLFGSSASFVDLVNFYRTVLKQKGDLVYQVPATQEFDVGRFREETMAFPPGVTIKDFESELSKGYPNPKAGGQPERFPTVIQIVPVVPER